MMSNCVEMLSEDNRKLRLKNEEDFAYGFWLVGVALLQFFSVEDGFCCWVWV